jgi:hypothetical protein
MGESDRVGPAAEPARDRGGEGASGRRRRGLSTASIRTNMKSVTVIAAVIGALGAIVAALIGVFFLLVQPLATRIINEYWNRTSEIRIADVRAAITDGKPTIDVVLWNPTSVAQAVVSVEVGLAQEGLPLALIEKSVYQLNGELLIDRSSGAVKGGVQTQDRIIYPFEGLLEVYARGGWSLLLTIPVREKLAPGDSRSILFVVPSNLDVIARGGDWLTGWLPFTSAGGLAEKYLAGPEKREFAVAEFLRGRGSTKAQVRAKRGDGKTAIYRGSITF